MAHAQPQQEPVFVPIDPLFCGDLVADACHRYDLPEVRYRTLLAHPAQDPLDVVAIALANDQFTPAGYSCVMSDSVLISVGDATHRPICALNTCGVCWLTKHITEITGRKIVDDLMRLHNHVARREVLLVMVPSPVLSAYKVRVCILNLSTHPSLAPHAAPVAPSSPSGFSAPVHLAPLRARLDGYSSGD